MNMGFTTMLILLSVLLVINLWFGIINFKNRKIKSSIINYFVVGWLSLAILTHVTKFYDTQKLKDNQMNSFKYGWTKGAKAYHKLLDNKLNGDTTVTIESEYEKDTLEFYDVIHKQKEIKE